MPSQRAKITKHLSTQNAMTPEDNNQMIEESTGEMLQ